MKDRLTSCICSKTLIDVMLGKKDYALVIAQKQFGVFNSVE